MLNQYDLPNFRYEGKRGSTARPLRFQLIDRAGPVTIAGTVTLVMTPKGKKTPRKMDDGTCSYEDQAVEANIGWVTYAWADADVDTVGIFDGEITQTLPNGKPVRYPVDKDHPYLEIEFLDTKEA